ncbi:MAG: hypothetical protein ACO3FK_12135 [Vulcanococcus sp.]
MSIAIDANFSQAGFANQSLKVDAVGEWLKIFAQCDCSTAQAAIKEDLIKTRAGIRFANGPAQTSNACVIEVGNGEVHGRGAEPGLFALMMASDAWSASVPQQVVA